MARAIQISENLVQLLFDESVIQSVNDVNEDLSPGTQSVLRQFMSSAIVKKGDKTTMGSPSRIIGYIENRLMRINPKEAKQVLSGYERNVHNPKVHPELKQFLQKILDHFKKLTQQGAQKIRAGRLSAKAASQGSWLKYQDRRNPNL
jgi:hypothetical protein